jgi:lipopolysaccharide export system protein LptA
MVIGDASESIEISSDDSFEIDNKRHVVTFMGNVEAVRDDMNIRCQKIELFYENLSGDNDPGEGQVKILEIIATENVRISRPEGGIATAEKAVYNQKDEKVVLTGNPAVKQGTEEISSDDSFEIDNKRHVVTFIGNVEAVRDDMNIKCQKIELFYENLSGDNDPGEGQVKVLEIIATENVRISRPEGGIATAEKAVYDQKDEKVVLTGNPTVKQGTDFVEGSKITLFLKEERIVVEGKAKAVLIPNEEKR